MSTPAARLRDTMLVAIAALLALAGFGACFYLAFERLQLEDTPATLLGTVAGTAWIGLVLAALGVERRRREVARGRALAAATARQEAQHLARVEALAAQPQWAHWAPLLRRRPFLEEAQLAEFEARYRALLADPRRAHHAAACLEGKFLTDTQIDYLDEPARRETCEHLRAVESGLREAGIGCLPCAARSIATDARLDPAALRVRYGLDAVVQWRSEEPHPHAPVDECLHCSACDSAIRSGWGAPFP